MTQQTPIHNSVLSFNISNVHGSIPSPRMCTMSMRALLLHLQSTYARFIATDSVSEWEKELNQFFRTMQNEIYW